MNDDMVLGELCRICGVDNAVLGYGLSKSRNMVRWYVDAFIGGKSAFYDFATYAEAKECFDRLAATVNNKDNRR